jgi:NAD-dependent dihydropyrimidine dehydrogenase PreA subunit
MVFYWGEAASTKLWLKRLANCVFSRKCIWECPVLVILVRLHRLLYA